MTRQLANKQKENAKKAGEILKNKGVKELKLYNFGIYYQYEMAGKKIRSYLLDGVLEDKLSDEDFDTLDELLGFTEEKDFTDNLGFPDEGQNILILNDEGEFSYRTFRI